jgi:50S ribosomal protein L16 3-hydroxylase
LRKPLAVLGGLTAADFARRYWHRRPLLVKHALPAFRDPLTRDEVAGLSCEPEVDSRLVLERGGRRPWEVLRGPQDATRLRRLPKSHWTLLVEGADRHVPALADLLDSFDFLPRWRVDDVMVSFAADEGTVGPHIDRYDVFLLQGHGRRRWQVDTQAKDVCRPGLDLRVLRSFKASAEWILESGDMLYLPPDLAHFGVAQGECLTYSVGVRAPRVRDLLFGCLERLGRSLDPATLHDDPDLEPQDEPGEIGPRALAGLRRAIGEAWEDASGRLPQLLGEILTEPTGLAASPRAHRLPSRELQKRLRADGVLVRDPAARVAFVRGQSGADLFVNGRRYPLPKAIAEAAPLLSRSRRVCAADLVRLLREPPFVALLTELVNDGTFDLVGPAARKAPPASGRARSGSPRARGSRARAADPSRGGGARGGRRGA